MRVVLDTSVLVAALRSQSGASRIVLSAVLEAKIQLVISAPLILEYEAVLTRPEQLLATGISISGVSDLLDEFCRIGMHVTLLPHLRPQLPDPNDEMVLETAVGGSAQILTTFNRGDFAGVSERFGIQILTPREILMKGEIQ
jgi:putative PIN family toxin of toxin-antitoxin system